MAAARSAKKRTHTQVRDAASRRRARLRCSASPPTGTGSRTPSCASRASRCATTRPQSRRARSSILGKQRWETGIEIEGGWDAHRAMLEARAPFRDVLMWRTLPDGARRYVSVSGEPMFDAKGRFIGYRGIGRDVTKQKRIQQLLKLDHAVTLRLAEAASARRGAERRAAGDLRHAAPGIARSSGRPTRPATCCAASRTGRRRARRARSASSRARRSSRSARAKAWSARSGRSGEPIWVPDSTADARALRTQLARETGLHAAALFPVRAGGRVAGGARIHLAAHAPARQAPVADARRDRHADRPVPRPRRGRARGARERSALPRAHQPVLRLVLGARRRVPLHAARGPQRRRRRPRAAAAPDRPARAGTPASRSRAAGTRTARCSTRASRSTTC